MFSSITGHVTTLSHYVWFQIKKKKKIKEETFNNEAYSNELKALV